MQGMRSLIDSGDLQCAVICPVSRSEMVWKDRGNGSELWRLERHVGGEALLSKDNHRLADDSRNALPCFPVAFKCNGPVVRRTQ